MKYLKSYNESIRDKMTPKSGEDIKKSLADLDAINKYSFIKKYNIKDLYSKEEMEELEKEVRINYNLNKEYINKKMTALAKTYNCVPQTYHNKEDDDFQVSFQFKNNLDVYLRTQIFSENFEVGYDFNEKHDWDFVESVEDGIYKINNWIDEIGVTVNEGIRDKMLPKSEEEIKSELDKLDPIQKMKSIKKYNINSLTKEELDSIKKDSKKYLSELNPTKRYFFISNNNLKDLYSKEEMYKLEKEVIEIYNLEQEDIIFAMTELAKRFDTKIEINKDKDGLDFDVEVYCNKDFSVYIRKTMESKWFEVGYYMLKRKGNAIDIDDVDSVEAAMFTINNWIHDVMFINEGIRDKMTPKSEEEIKKSLDSLPLSQKISKIFHHYKQSIFKNETPYYTQKEIDELVKEYIKINDEENNVRNNVESYVYYYSISDLIKHALKRELSKLSALKQLEYISNTHIQTSTHTFSKDLKDLYTEEELKELKEKSNEEANEYKSSGSVKIYTHLIGKIAANIIVNEDSIIFEFNDGEEYTMTDVDADLADVNIEDINGDIEDLIGVPLLKAEEVSATNPDASESGTWTFYKFATIKGYVDVRWYGSSNGYYCEEATIRKTN